MGVPAMDSGVASELQDAIVLSEGWSSLARAVPGATWDPAEKRYVLPRSALNSRSATVTLKVLPHLGVTYPELGDAQADITESVRPRDHASELKLEVNAPLTRAALRNERDADPYDYQRHDLGYVAGVLRAHGSAYLGWERGMGKTFGAFAVAEDLGVKRVLVIAPNTAKDPVWGEHVRHGYTLADGVVLPNGKKKREACLEEVRTHTGDVMLIVHPEALDIVASMRANKRGWDRLGEWDLVVADEAHRFKNQKAKQTRALKKIPTKYKLAMSGSIIENNLEELFSQLQWLYPERYRSKWRDWNLRFVEYVEGAYGRIAIGVRPEALHELEEELGVFLVYRRKDEVLDMPPRTDQTLMVDISPAQRKAYGDLVTECVTQLEDGTMVAAEDGLPVLMKLRQVASGLDLLSGDVADSTKLDLVTDLIQDTSEPVVVFGWFKASLTALAARLGEEVSLITGDVSHTERTKRLADFNAGRTRVLAGTISTIGESMNLQRASQAILMDRSWNPMQNQQAEDRVYRLGQDKPVTITHVVARDTVDELRVQPVLASKEALRRTILGG